MKKIILLVSVFLLFAGTAAHADDYISEQADAAGIDKMEKFYSENIGGFDFDLEEMIESIYTGSFELSFSGVIKYILQLFTGGIQKNISAAVTLLLIAVLCGFSGNLNSLGKGGGGAAFYVCFSVICGLCAALFSHTAERGAAAISLMSDFVKVTAPALTTLCMAGGEAGYAAVLPPLLYGASAVSINAANAYVIPLSYGAFSLNAVGALGDGINLSRGIKLMKNFSKWIMTFLMTVFSGVSVICTAAGGAMNALAGKTVKFAVGSFIPVVGGMLADSMDMVATCTGIVKKAVGAGGMCVIMLIFLSCAIELAVQLVLLRCAAAFSALLCSDKIVTLLDGTADCISIVLAALCMCSFLFLVIITIMIGGVMT